MAQPTPAQLVDADVRWLDEHQPGWWLKHPDLTAGDLEVWHEINAGWIPQQRLGDPAEVGWLWRIVVELRRAAAASPAGVA